MTHILFSVKYEMKGITRQARLAKMSRDPPAIDYQAIQGRSDTAIRFISKGVLPYKKDASACRTF